MAGHMQRMPNLCESKVWGHTSTMEKVFAGRRNVPNYINLLHFPAMRRLYAR